MYENTTTGVTIGTVIATDEDVGKYGQITYSLIGDTVHQTFRIQPDSGKCVSALHVYVCVYIV